MPGGTPSNSVPYWERIEGYCQRQAASALFRRPVAINPPRPVISFTFDDFPESALSIGGSILNRFDAAGTYYASLGLMGQDTPSGRIFKPGDLKVALDHGHELGCHTFAHCHSWNTTAGSFDASIRDNSAALADLLPGVEFKTFSYPICVPWPLTKSKVTKRFLCSRGGGQRPNIGTADRHLLSAYFLEKSRHDIQPIRDMIDRNRDACGWLIFATHDIAERPTPFGCTPTFFEDVVRYAVASGACVLPVVKALETLGLSGGGSTVPAGAVLSTGH